MHIATRVHTTTNTHSSRDNNNNTSKGQQQQHIADGETTTYRQPEVQEADEGTQHLVVEEATTNTHNNVQLPAREGDTTHNEQGPIRRAGKAAPSAINGAMVVAME